MTSSGNLLSALQQLREAQDRTVAAEARAAVLEDENKLLRLALNELEQQQKRHPLSARNFEVLEAECAALRGDRDANDKLVSELQRQLADMTRRNTMLETESQTRHSALRHQYESHIDSLELELRRARAFSNNGNSSHRSGAGKAATGGGGVVSASPSPMVLPFQISSPTSDFKRQSIL